MKKRTYKDPIKRKQYMKEYCKQWYQRKKAGLQTDNRVRVSPEHTRLRLNERNKEFNKKRYAKWKQQISELLGDYCVICGYTSHLICHKKDGTPHTGYYGNMLTDAIESPSEFIRVCYGCHKGIHWSMQWFNMSWEQIIDNINRNRSLEG